MDSKRFIIIIAAVVVGFMGFMLLSIDKAEVKVEDSSIVAAKGSNNVYGKIDSKVTLTEFVDFQCEACYAYFPHVKQLKEKYKDTVKFQIRNFPIASHHQYSLVAARSAEAAARQGKFFEMHDMLFKGQPEWSKSQNPQEHFDHYAKEIGLDMAKYETDAASSDVLAVINKDLEDVKAAGGDGTPTFLLNGKKIENPGASLDALSKVLDSALGASSEQ